MKRLTNQRARQRAERAQLKKTANGLRDEAAAALVKRRKERHRKEKLARRFNGLLSDTIETIRQEVEKQASKHLRRFRGNQLIVHMALAPATAKRILEPVSGRSSSWSRVKLKDTQAVERFFGGKSPFPPRGTNDYIIF